jgi:hypothetical protein
MSQDQGGAGSARQWQEMAAHLVQAHGGDASALISYGPTLEQLHFAHADTHVTLASIGAAPPDNHTHGLPVNAGRPDARPSSCRPFQPSPQAQDDPFGFGFSYTTGLPQTGWYPTTDADLARWAAGQPFATLSGDETAMARQYAARAAARRASRVSFPSPVQALPPAQDDRSTARQTGRQIPRQARRR